MEYFLMRKNDVITLCDLTDDGVMISYSEKYRNFELAPLGFRTSPDYLKRWWQNRQIPIRQGRVQEMLSAKGLLNSGEYLLKNLGLGLTDYYWIKPVDSGLRWEDVNLFDNDFKDNILFDSSEPGSKGSSESFTPNSSLKGELEKTWMIRNGKRVLIKGNRSKLSSESINEVIATELHKALEYDNYAKYKLLKIKNKPYDYGCYSEAFTNSSKELVSAYALITSEEKPDGLSDYEHLINVVCKYGADDELLIKDLEYQIMTDYLLSNVDRHMENIAFIRDADSLKIIRMAPIFDTGRAFGGYGVVPYTDKEISEIEVNSFEGTEAKLLRLVRDKSILDLSKVIPVDRVYELYKKDSQADSSRIDAVCRLYEKKIERLKEL